ARQLSAGAGLAATAGFGTGGRVCRRNPGRSGDRRAGRLAASSRDAPAPAARTCISLRSGCFGRRARVGLGWPPPGYDGQAVPPLLLNTGAKNLYDQKTPKQHHKSTLEDISRAAPIYWRWARDKGLGTRDCEPIVIVRARRSSEEAQRKRL